MTPSGDARDRRGRRVERLERLSVLTLYLAGGYFLVVPVLLPGPLGWNLVREQFGETRVLCFAVGFLFLYMGAVTREKQRLRAVTLDTVEALQMLLFGRDYRRHREAVDLLLRALRSSDRGGRQRALASLERMTGKDFGDDPAAWETWWRGARSRFRLGGDQGTRGGEDAPDRADTEEMP